MNFIERARGALLDAGPSACLWGRSAAYLHHLDLSEPETIDVMIPWVNSGERPDLDGVRIRPCRAEGRRPGIAAPLPHTDIVDTVLDLGDHTDPETCVYWLTESTRRGLVTVPDLCEALSARNRHRHRRLIRDIAEDVASGATSNLEVRYARRVERAHRLPRAERQFIVPETGHRADFAYPHARLLIELDGLAYHSGEAAQRDRLLDEQHALAGWATCRYTWASVSGNPCSIAYEVARLLRGAGVAAVVEPCSLELA